MSDFLHVHVDTSGIVPWGQRLDAATRRAAQMSGSSAIRAMKAEGSRRIRERKAMKVSHVGRALTISFPSDKQTLLWRLKAEGAFMPVIAFGPRQIRKGVSVTINKGKRVLIPSAFIATMRSGYTGVFRRVGQATRTPIQRYRGHARYAGQKRQPIREAFTTRVSEAFTDAIPAITDRGLQVFLATFRRVLPLETKPTRNVTISESNGTRDITYD